MILRAAASRGPLQLPFSVLNSVHDGVDRFQGLTERQRSNEPKNDMLCPACAVNRALAPPDLFEASALSRSEKAAAREARGTQAFLSKDYSTLPAGN